MKTLKLLAFAALVMIFISCGGKKDSENTNSANLKVKLELGDLENYISLNDEEVVLELKDENQDGKDYKAIVSSLSIKVNRSVASDFSYDISAEIFDSYNMNICSLPATIESGYDYNNDFRYYLNAGTIDVQIKELIDAADWDDSCQERWDMICTQGKSIVLKPRWSYAKYAEYKDDSSSSSDVADDSDVEEVAESSSSSSEDFDAVLDSYEKYVDKYISLLKKASKGDLTAVAEYPSLLQQAEEFGDKLESAKGDLTASQMARFNKIQAKMLKAAQEMK